MLKWALIFAAVSILAGLLGFTTLAGVSAAIAKFLFFLFLAICLILFVLAYTLFKKVTE